MSQEEKKVSKMQPLQKTGAEFIAETFKAYGVSHVFLVMAILRKTLVDTLLDGVSQGVFKPEIAIDAEKIAINLFAYLDGIGFHYIIGKSHFDLMEQVNFYLDNLIEQLRKE